MENIIIVDCISTGKLFIKDIVKRNYHPIVLEINLNNPNGTPNKIQEKISKLENGDAYKNSEETNTALLIKIKRGLDDTLKNMFNFSYENFLNKDSENESKKSYLDI